MPDGSLTAFQPAGSPYLVPLIDVESSNVGRIGYEGHAQRLYVQFRDKRADNRDGALYAYEGVPEAVYDTLLDPGEDYSGSVGSAFHHLVKAAGYEYRRIG